MLYVGLRYNIIQNISEAPDLNDVIKIYHFTAKLKNKNGVANGASFSQKKALIKTIGEALERYFLTFSKSKKLVWDSYSHLKNKAIDPKSFLCSFKNKRKLFLYTNERQRMRWIKGFSFLKNRKLFIPAQLVFAPYKYRKEEPLLSPSISTGAAFYTSLEGAILKGLLEIIERDAFMISYLNKLPRNIIEINSLKTKVFKKVSNQIGRYNLKLYVLDISTEVPVYSILALIIDKTGIGPVLSLGMSSNVILEDAVIGAMEEACQGNYWARKELMETRRKEIKAIIKRKSSISTFRERMLLWAKPYMIKKIQFFLEGRKISSVKKLSKKKVNNLNELINWFKKRKIDVIYVDLTPRVFRKYNFYVVKVLIPNFQPLYLEESKACYLRERLKEIPAQIGFKPIKKLYSFPHPFL